MQLFDEVEVNGGDIMQETNFLLQTHFRYLL
jgi:hypothetical protein